MEIEIFDVEHGACALLTADNGCRLLFDCGHNTSTDWRPSKSLPARGIHAVDALVVSNYDEDHVSDFPNLMSSVLVQTLIRNPSVRPRDLLSLKSESGAGLGIGTLAHMAGNHYVAPVARPLDLGGVSMWHFWNVYPSFDDENNLSLVTILRYEDFGIIFPGDMEKAGWRQLMTRSDFRTALTGVNVFVASHHGRDSGYVPELFNFCSPELVIFSDKSIKHETQKTAHLYRQHAKGVQFFDGETRYVLTTRDNGYIRMSKQGTGPAFVWISKK
ncbi:ComEC/Rec2 family competence protein [Georgfuchsia toluolica]|uniref:ComEC/Rec2 family competence protein n=1 Tax=Georgfuchsia toluolica TaxID=424218 RepID=UPI001C73400E|nr:hypothetical protein [Georgfuchsia toluolica]